MAISGTWAERSANAQAYTGALRWGTGIDPIHGIRDNPGRPYETKENLYPLGDASDAVADVLLDGDYFTGPDWGGEQPYPGEDFRYQDTEPRWDQTTPQFRDATESDAMGEWTSWGVYNDDNPVDGFPQSGPTGGMAVALDVSHGEDQERQHAIAVPTRGVAGGWKNKSHAAPALAAGNDGQDVGDPLAQWAVNTGKQQDQGVKSLDNSRAIQRGTDKAREPILSRVAGMRQYSPGTSFGMGGGAGTPDMQPYQQTAGLKRPFVNRAPGLPPFEDHTWNEMEQRYPLQRTVPPDPYQGDPEVSGTTPGTGGIYDYGGADDAGDVDWGYF